MWHVSSRSCVATLRTAIHLLLTYLQCYLPPGRGDIPALTQAEAGSRLSDPGGMQDLVGLVYPPEDGHPSTY